MKLEPKTWKTYKGVTEEEFMAFSGPEVDSVGTKRWNNSEGKFHRLDGPAVEWARGSKEWWVEGKRHRLDGPAVELVGGDKEWWVDGQWHRLGGPALEWVDGDKWWWAYGKRHRLDGPAIEEANGRKEWWVEGKRMTEEEFMSFSGPEVDSDGTKHWKNSEGKLHRLDGPAFEWSDGYKEWWVVGELHRLDGPAVEYVDGSKAWWVEGKKHRLDGPAVEWADGSKEWWVEGKEMPEEEFMALNGPEVDSSGNKRWRNSERKLHRLDGPAIEGVSGHREWRVGGKLHRLDGPAIERADGDKEWWVGGNLHRLDGPAVDRVSGYKAWWVDGKKMTEEEFMCINGPEVTLVLEKIMKEKIMNKPVSPAQNALAEAERITHQELNDLSHAAISVNYQVEAEELVAKLKSHIEKSTMNLNAIRMGVKMSTPKNLGEIAVRVWAVAATSVVIIQAISG